MVSITGGCTVFDSKIQECTLFFGKAPDDGQNLTVSIFYQLVLFLLVSIYGLT